MRRRLLVSLGALVLIACNHGTVQLSFTVSGLQGSGLVVSDSLDSVFVTTSGTYTFPTPITSYSVSVTIQPTSPAQICTVANGRGVVKSNVSNVSVTCAVATFTVGGTVSGLTGSGLALQDNGGDMAQFSPDGSFTFMTPVASGATYAVTVQSQPKTPSQTCIVADGTGTVGNGNVTTVAVLCSASPYAVGGTVTGLSGTGLALQDNGGDDLAILGNGAFTFGALVDSGQPYAVTVLAQPIDPAQNCTVSGGTGTVGSGAVTAVSINCNSGSYTIGGTVTGLVGSGLVLMNGASESLSITGDGSFSFSSPFGTGATYQVTVATQPTMPSETCTVSNGTGTIDGMNVTSVSVMCLVNEFNIGGTVSGLSGLGLTLALNDGTPFPITSDGTFAFPTQIADGSPYAVTVGTSPVAPWQTCTLTGDHGIVSGGPVTNVQVSCTSNAYAVGGNVFGLTGSGLALTDNGGDSLPIASGGNGFTFDTPVPSGDTYSVAIAAQPGSQECTVLSGMGTVGSGPVTSVTVVCTGLDGGS